MAGVYLQLHFTAVGMVPLFRGEGCRIPSLPRFMSAFSPLPLVQMHLSAEVYPHPRGWVGT